MLEALGNLGDFVGGAAVVVTLLYLAFQVRQNTLSVRSAALDTAADRFSKAQAILARDPELADLLVRGHADFKTLEGGNRLRYRAYLISEFLRIESSYRKHREGLLHSSRWEGQEAALIYSLHRPGWQECWKEVNPIFGAEFRNFVNKIIKQLKEPAA